MILQPGARAKPISEQVLARQDQLEGCCRYWSRTGGRFGNIFSAHPSRRAEEYDDKDRNPGPGLFMHDTLGEIHSKRPSNSLWVTLT